MRTTATACFRLLIFDHDKEPIEFKTADPDIAWSEYEKNLKELQETAKSFNISISIYYEAAGSHNRMYSLKIHNQTGEILKEDTEADKRTLEKHIASGFFSANPKVLMPLRGWAK